VTAGSTLYTRSDGPIRYVAESQIYTVYAPNNVMQTFGPDDRESSSPSGTIAYTKSGTGGADRFRIIQPAPSTVAMDYTRTTFLDTAGGPTSGTRARTTAYCVIGVPTLTTDIPSAASVTFTRFAVAGEAYDRRGSSLITYSLAKSTATLAVDLTTGQIRATLNLIGTANGSDVSLGNFTIDGAIGESDAGISGMGYVGSAPTPGGTISVNGGFFGPQGKEFGYTFSQSISTFPLDGSPSELVFTMVGTVTGAR